jgi:hypothetical protein
MVPEKERKNNALAGKKGTGVVPAGIPFRQFD